MSTSAIPFRIIMFRQMKKLVGTWGLDRELYFQIEGDLIRILEFMSI